MKRKLTIELENKLLDDINTYAKEHKTSVSEIIERYLDGLIHQTKEVVEITPFVRSLSGIIKATNFNKNEYSEYSEYSDYLIDKYC